MSGTHNKLQYGNNYNYWKILDLVLDPGLWSLSRKDFQPEESES